MTGRVRILSILLAVSWASAQTITTQFASGVTAPQGGAILSGSAINPATGKPIRFLWSGDPVNGLCRLDPDLDTAGIHTINPATCVKKVIGGTINFKPGQLSFDPPRNLIYAVDMEGKSLGVFRLHFHPDGDSGRGLIDLLQQELLGGQGTAIDHCNIGANTPTAGVLGPDGELYVGFSHTGNVMRILAPQTEPLPCSNIQATVATTLNTPSEFGFGWIGTELFGADGLRVLRWPNAVQCFSPANNFAPCPASPTFITNPNLMTSDQVYPALNGSRLYLASHLTITQISNITNTVTGPVTTLNYGGLFQFISGLAVDSSNPTDSILYLADDPSSGAQDGQGRWWQIAPAPPAPAPPGTPTSVIASPGDTTAGVNWTPAQDGQPVTSFTVRNSSASNNLTVADVIVTPPVGSAIVPTSATITGLTDGVTYQFEVRATNGFGSSAFSAPSNAVTPLAATVPGAPTGVTASAANAQALVVWTAPSNGGLPITSYTVTALSGGVSTGITATVVGAVSGAVVNGLTNGVAYTFTVHATNAIGSGPESAPAGPVTPFVPITPPDVSVTMTGPASVAFQSNGIYTITVANVGGSAAAQVNLTDTLPIIGATVVSITPSQGACSSTIASITCNLGSLAAGSSATVTLALNLLAAGTNKASAQVLDANGIPVTDPTAADDSASVAITISGAVSTTDIQLTGSAQNGGPAVGTGDVLTWQVKNGNNQVANAVVFQQTLPSSFLFLSASPNVGSCSAPASGTFSATILCSVSSLAVGQTMVVTVNFVPTASGGIGTTAQATFNGTDTNPVNNTGAVVLQVK